MNLQLISEIGAYASAVIGLICVIFGLIIRKRLAGHLAYVVNWVLVIAFGFILTQANNLLSVYFGFEEMIGQIIFKLIISIALLGIVCEIYKMIKAVDSKKDGFYGKKKKK